MAKKVETISLIDTFSEFKELKNIDRTTMVSVLEESFRSVIAKMFATDENYEDLENPNLQIALSEAQKIDASYEVGEEVTDEVIFANFGRRAILNLRQTLASKILELEKDSIYNKYIDKVGNIINAEVYQIWKKVVIPDPQGVFDNNCGDDRLHNRTNDLIKYLVCSSSVNIGSFFQINRHGRQIAY